MFGPANRFKNFLNIAIVPYHIIKIIFILNGSGHVAGYMFGCQFRLRPRGSPVLSFPHESPIPLNHLDSLKTDVSRKSVTLTNPQTPCSPLGILKSAVLAEKPSPRSMCPSYFSSVIFLGILILTVILASLSSPVLAVMVTRASLVKSFLAVKVICCEPLNGLVSVCWKPSPLIFQVISSIFPLGLPIRRKEIFSPIPIFFFFYRLPCPVHFLP